MRRRYRLSKKKKIHAVLFGIHNTGDTDARTKKENPTVSHHLQLHYRGPSGNLSISIVLEVIHYQDVSVFTSLGVRWEASSVADYIILSCLRKYLNYITWF